MNNYTAGIFKLLEPGDDPVKMQAQVDERAAECQRFFRTYFGPTAVVRGFIFETDDSVYHPTYAQNGIREFIAANGTKGWQPQYHCVWGGAKKDGNCGSAVQGTRYCACYRTCDVETIKHELLHLLENGHAGRVRGDGTIEEYRGGRSVMGSNRVDGLNAVNMRKQGLLSERSTLTFNDGDEAQQIFLRPLESSDKILHPNEYRDLHIPRGRYDIAIRKHRGFPYGVSKNEEPILHVTWEREKNGSLRDISDLYPGFSRVIAGNKKIEYVNYDWMEERAIVNILPTVATTSPNDLPLPIGFVKPPGAQILPEHSGSWYYGIDGQGFMINVKGDDVIGYHFTHNEDRDRAAPSMMTRWYWFVGKIIDGVAEFTIQTTENLDYDNPTKYKLIDAGTGSLAFTGAETGVFQYNMPEFGVGGLELALIEPTANPLSGAWYFPDQEGSGFVFEFFDRPFHNAPHGKCDGVWFNYGEPKKRPGSSQPLAHTTQRWWYFSGSAAPDRKTYHFDILEVSGGKWGQHHEVQKKQVGIAELFVDSRELTWAMNGKSGSGILKRLL